MTMPSSFCPCWENLFSIKPCLECQHELKKLLLPRTLSENSYKGFKIYSMSRYEGRMREFIIQSKCSSFNGLLPSQKNLLKSLSEYWSSELQAHKIDHFVPIPGHPIRSFMQSDLAWYLARYLSQRLQKGEPQSFLKRRLFVDGNIYLPQKHLDKVERSERIKSQYFIKNKCETKKRICLVDDVHTTGSTLRFCRDMLTQANYEVPVAIVLANVSLQ